MPRDPDSLDLKWDLAICISFRFPHNMQLGLRTTLYLPVQGEDQQHQLVRNAESLVPSQAGEPKFVW